MSSYVHIHILEITGQLWMRFFLYCLCVCALKLVSPLSLLCRMELFTMSTSNSQKSSFLHHCMSFLTTVLISSVCYPHLFCVLQNADRIFQYCRLIILGPLLHSFFVGQRMVTFSPFFYPEILGHCFPVMPLFHNLIFSLSYFGLFRRPHLVGFFEF